MRLTVALLLFFTFQVHANGRAQTITLVKANAALLDVFKAIEKQTDYLFFFDRARVQQAAPVSLRLVNASIDQSLTDCLKGTHLAYAIVDNTIVITEQPTTRVTAFKADSPPPPVEVRGRITDEEGNPLSGVSVTIAGTQQGTTTGSDGRFRVYYDSEETKSIRIEFSSVGFISQTIEADGSREIDVVLKPSDSSLSDIVVVGYGTQQRARVTGAMSTISQQDITDRPITSASQILQGTVSGAFITQTSGQPGNDATRIRIRGVALNLGGGSSDPFILIDGIEGSIDRINPNDIESVSVLKDASAAAIYGARAANGVVLVTTKRGSGKLTVGYDNYVGITSPTDLPKMITNSAVYMELANEMYRNSGVAEASLPFPQADIDRYRNDPSLPNTNWMDVVFNQGVIQQHNLSVNGGDGKTKYAFSAGYLSQTGNVDNFKTDRYNFRLNLDHEIRKGIRLGSNLSGYRRINNGPYGDINNIITSTSVAQPNTAPYKSPDGRFGSGAYAPGIRFVRSPMAWIDKQSGFRENIANNFTGNLFAEIDILKGLTLKGSAAYRLDMGTNRVFQRGWETIRWAPDLTGDEPTEQIEFKPPQRNESSSENVYRNLYATLDYNRSFGKAHDFHVMVGANEEYFRDRSFSGYIRDGFPEPFVEFAQGSQSPENSVVDGDVTELVVQSYFGRFNYSYDDRLLFEASLRSDAVSNFAPEYRRGYFPSISAGWNIAREDWFSSNMINDLKFRASWGRLGEYRGISRYAYLALVNAVSGYSFGGALVDGAGTTVAPSESIVWQSNETRNIGLDAGFFRNRLSLSLDYFIKDNNNQLGNTPLVAFSGMGQPVSNPYSIRNKGWELTLNYRNRDHRFKYGAGLNLTNIKNEVTDINGLSIRSGIFLYEEGLPAKVFRLYQVEGIFQSADEVAAANAGAGGVYQLNITGPGDLKYKDISGPDGKPDGKITDADRVVMGNPFPAYTFGFNLNAEYEGFDFMVLFQGVSQFDFYISEFGLEPMQDNIPVKFLNRWTPDNPNTNVHRLVRDVNANNRGNSYHSDYYLQNGSYLRLKNVQLGYTLPERVLGRSGIKSARIFLNSQNPLTFTSLEDGFDPERLGSSDPNGATERATGYHPQIVITTIGLNIKF